MSIHMVGSQKRIYVGTDPENLANFIGARGYDAKKIVITDVLDRLIVNTCMGCWMFVRTRNYVGELLSIWRRSSWREGGWRDFGGGTQCGR